jgi:hypothetical protein
MLWGNGDGTFDDDNVAVGAGTYPWSIATADFNEDGRLDMVVTNQFSRDATLLFGAAP